MKKVVFSLIIIFSSIQFINAQYKIGDIYNKNEVKGIVVQVNEKGEHGLIMSLKGCDNRWCKNEVKTAVGAIDENDGAVNMEAVKNYISSNNLSWDAFPLFKWANELGDGWYIPAKNELQTIAENINGGSLDKYNQKNIKSFNKIIKKNDGKGLIMNGLAKSNDFLSMDSSTETAGNMVYTLQFMENAGSMVSQMALGKLASRKGKLELTYGMKRFNGGKNLGNHYSRAIHKF